MNPKPALACAAVLALTACSGDVQPTGSFQHEGTRVFEAYGQSRDVTRKVTIPPATKDLRLKMDCINTSGHIKVDVGIASGDLACGEDSAPGGYIGIGRSPENRWDTITSIVVTAPAGATWSVAVDAVDAP